MEGIALECNRDFRGAESPIIFIGDRDWLRS
jgi:hypothetical protein